MKFFGLALVAVTLCLAAGCSDSADPDDVTAAPPASTETTLGEASGSPEEMLDDSASPDESGSKDATSTK